MLISRLVILLSLMLLASVSQAKPICKDGDAPKVIKKLENYDIIATNDASIPTAQAFQGQQLTYSVHYRLQNSKNKVSMNAKTGMLLVKAEKKDDFDVKITAKNPCGKAEATFNIVIDEEE